jgi:hypothetical protein
MVEWELLVVAANEIVIAAVEEVVQNVNLVVPDSRWAACDQVVRLGQLLVSMGAVELFNRQALPSEVVVKLDLAPDNVVKVTVHARKPVALVDVEYA